MADAPQERTGFFDTFTRTVRTAALIVAWLMGAAMLLGGLIVLMLIADAEGIPL